MLFGMVNFCLLIEIFIVDVVVWLNVGNVKILDGLGECDGVNGLILFVYFYDLDGNFVEVSNVLN